MKIVEIFPLITGGLAVIYLLSLATSKGDWGKGGWILPAVLCIALILWSLSAASQEGPFGFWQEHIRNLWANQIWFDLLLAASTAFTFMVPRARARGMRLLPWAIAVLALGSIGLLAFWARIAFLEQRKS